MLGQLKSAVVIPVCLLLALLLTLCLPVGAQGTPALKDPAGTNSDALAFLNEVFELYAHATSYDLEFVEEQTLTAEFSRLWTKSLTIAIVEPGKGFRFEAHGHSGSAVQISNGKTEWIYYPPFQQYIEHAAASTGPTPIHAPATPGLYLLNMAQRTPKVLSDLRKLVGTAAYGPDETIEVNGKTVACKIIKTEGELPQSSAHITARFTFWVDQKTHLIRKMTELRKGPLNPTDPDMNYVMERLTLFTIADLNAVPQADETFKFTPPMTASLVEQIEDPISAAIGQLVGKQAPEIGLKATDGKDIFLKSFQGKPVLLDFWATWCPPCVESLPALEKLYREIAKSGLIFLSLDQDEQSRTAEEFWSRHNEPWPNFHASADTLGHFPKHGIPYFVLIDASGQIVFSAAGFDETALRAAFAKLGPAFTATP